jgi:type I restriction enzyme M protein
MEHSSVAGTETTNPKVPSSKIAIISMPSSGLPCQISSMVTSIPACIMVYKKCRETPLKISSSSMRVQGFEKSKKNQKYPPWRRYREKIISSYRNRESDRENILIFATREEIRENDYKSEYLSRYVDTFEEEEEIDIDRCCEWKSRA